MGIKVCKFGGTSMADGNVILAAAKIVKADPRGVTSLFPRPVKDLAAISK